MANSVKQQKSAADGESKVSFEEAIERLEEIILEMENNEIPLEKVIERYEEGINLVKICQQRLSESEMKIKELEKKMGGEFQLKTLNLNGTKNE